MNHSQRLDNKPKEQHMINEQTWYACSDETNETLNAHAVKDNKDSYTISPNESSTRTQSNLRRIANDPTKWEYFTNPEELEVIEDTVRYPKFKALQAELNEDIRRSIDTDKEVYSYCSGEPEFADFFENNHEEFKITQFFFANYNKEIEDSDKIEYYSANRAIKEVTCNPLFIIREQDMLLIRIDTSDEEIAEILAYETFADDIDVVVLLK